MLHFHTFFISRPPFNTSSTLAACAGGSFDSSGSRKRFRPYIFKLCIDNREFEVICEDLDRRMPCHEDWLCFQQGVFDRKQPAKWQGFIKNEEHEQGGGGTAIPNPGI